MAVAPASLYHGSEETKACWCDESCTLYREREHSHIGTLTNTNTETVPNFPVIFTGGYRHEAKLVIHHFVQWHTAASNRIEYQACFLGVKAAGV